MFEAVSTSFQKIGIKLEKKPLTVCGFISDNHIFEREVFAEYVDLVLTLDWSNRTWKLHDLHGHKYDRSGVVHLPPMFEIK